MQRTSRYLPVLGVAALLLVCGCDAWTRAQGTVRDTWGRPIPDATITIKIGKESRAFHSLSDGRYLVSMWQPPFKQDVTITVAKSGYLESEKHIKGPGVYKDFDMVLSHPHEESADTPESIAKAMFFDAPENKHDVNCFRSLAPTMSVDQVAEKCGRPDAEVGSGLLIFVWNMPGGSSVSMGTSTLDRIGEVRFYDASSKKTSVLIKGR
jgi:hypothetical protein